MTVQVHIVCTKPFRGTANHGPMFGWAIQKGHTITWSDRAKNYLPNSAGTAEEWWLGGTVARDHIGWMDGVG